MNIIISNGRTSGMKLPESGLPLGFQFSQGSLQDFVDCRRRFHLRYIMGLSWPALQTEPAMENERAMQRGARFHRLVHRHLLGVPAERLGHLAFDQDLESWWENYLQHSPALTGFSGPEVTNLPERPPQSGLYPEITLTAALNAYRLVAKYDLIVARPEGSFVIVDWKTSRKRPRREWLAERLQTRVYPYLLARAGSFLNAGKPLPADRLEMIYWFAEFPDQPERFTYSGEQYQEDVTYISGLVDEIGRLEEGDFTLTERVERCDYCIYRSLCDRGVEAGSLDDLQDDLEMEASGGVTLDFEQIVEIEF